MGGVEQRQIRGEIVGEPVQCMCELMPQHVHGGGAIFWVFRERTLYEIFELWWVRKIATCERECGRICVDVSQHDLVGAASLEGRFTCEDFVDNDTHRVDVRAVVALALACLLRGHVSGRPDGHSCAREALILFARDHLGDPKVEDLNALIWFGASEMLDDEDVVWFEVAVKDPARVGEADGVTDLMDD